MRVVLFQPEIPPNTGNIARLCAALGIPLHLIEPLGFGLEDRRLKRAGLDYWPHVDVTVWPGWEAFFAARGNSRLIAASARNGGAVHAFSFVPDDSLLFGPETRGLPGEVLEQCHAVVRIPISGKVRSLNLSTAAGIVLHQAMVCAGLLGD